MQYLGEICMAQRSRGRDKQDKWRVKARKGFSNRRFERRFWVLLPPRAKVPRAGARNILLDNPSARVFRACGRGGRMWASAPTHGYRWSFRRGRCPHRPARMTHGLSVDVHRGGALPSPFSFPSFVPPAGYFLSLAKESNQRTPFKGEGISISLPP